MVDSAAGLGDRSVADGDVRRHKHPWSRGRSLALLVAMMIVSALLTMAGIQIVVYTLPLT